MYGDLNSKIQILNSFDQKHLAVLNALMLDKDFKLPALASQLGYQVSTVRNFLTDIYKACGVPESVEDKRGYIVREYSEAYLKKDLPSEEEKPTEEREDESQEHRFDNPTEKPVIHITPPPPRRRIELILSIIVVAIITIIVLSAINNKIPPTNPTDNQPPFQGYYGAFQDIYLLTGVTMYAARSAGVCDTEEDYWAMALTINNDSGHDYDMGISGTEFSLVDSFGRSYRLLSAEMSGTGDDKQWQRIYSDHSAGIHLCWLDRPNMSGAEYLELKIENLTNGGSDLYIRFHASDY